MNLRNIDHDDPTMIPNAAPECCGICGAEVCAHGNCSTVCDECLTSRTPNPAAEVARLQAENARLRELLAEASRRLTWHHEASVWDEAHARKHGYMCPICTKPDNIFVRIAAALASKDAAPMNPDETNDRTNDSGGGR